MDRQVDLNTVHVEGEIVESVKKKLHMCTRPKYKFKYFNFEGFFKMIDNDKYKIHRMYKLTRKKDSQYTEYNLHNLDTYFTTFWILPIIFFFPLQSYSI